MRTLIRAFEFEFQRLHRESVEFLKTNPFERLFAEKRSKSNESPGMLLVRSAAKVEQCFGGLSSRLWDDPFEWTLPEAFAEKSIVLEYLGEVEKARKNGFLLLRSDSDLEKEIAAPGGMKTIADVICEALEDARAYLARAGEGVKTPD